MDLSLPLSGERASRLHPRSLRLLASERTMIRIRWAGVVFGIVQVITYYRPYPPGVEAIALALVAALAAGNFTGWVMTRLAKTNRTVQILAVSSTLLDVLIVTGLVFVYTFDPDTAIWALIYVLPLEGAIRFQMRGAIWTMVTAAGLYTVREIYGNVAFGNEFLPTSISFRMGIGFIIAAVGGATASRLVKERAQAEERAEAHARVEHQLKEAQQIAHVGSFDWDIDTGQIQWSDEMFRIHGYEPAEFDVTYERSLERIKDSDVVRIQKILESSFLLGADHSISSIELRLELPGDIEKVVRTGGWLYFREGRPVRLIGVMHDISELHAALDSLRAQHDLYEGLMQAASDLGEGVAIVDLETFRFTWLNPAVSRMLAIPQEELLAQSSVLDLADDRARASLKTWVERQQKGREKQEFETQFVRGDGMGVSVEVSMRRLDSARSMMILRDITGRKRTEEAVQRLASVVSSSDDAIVSLRPTGSISTWNSGAERLFGYTDVEAVALAFFELISSDSREEFDPLLRRVVAGEHIRRFETTGVRQDGSMMDLALTMSPVRNEDASVAAISIIGRDVTERKRAERALRESLAREKEVSESLRQLDAMKDEFLSLVSHELKTPLTVISGFAATLLSSFDRLKEEQRSELLERILDRSHGMRDMVEQLLDLTRLEGGRIQVEVEQTAVAPEVERVLDSLQGPLERHRVELHIPVGVEAMLDPYAFERVLTNLLTNAAKYSPKDSNIRIKAECQTDEVVVSVADEGEGIPEDEQERIFDRFYRLRGSFAPGTGVGLTVAKRYAESMGGRLWLQSSLGEGTTFFFSLSRQPAATEATVGMSILGGPE